MNRYLSPEALNEVRRNISRTLTDTFQMMFQLDIFLMPHLQRHKDSRAICSYIELTHEAARANLTIAITREVVEYIVERLQPEASASRPVIMQDAVCEIANIVGNHVRSYLADKTGIEFKIGLPASGMPPMEDSGAHVINLHFRIKENDRVDLDFSYKEPPQAA